jgi:hypothetical protein
VAERGILFSAPMVRALLAGTKTQTRRAVKPQPPEWAKFPQQVGVPADGLWEWTDRNEDTDDLQHWPNYDKPMRCPYGKPGDRLWVRETWRERLGDGTYAYRATHDGPFTWESYKWRPSIFMPRAASRITLEITAVRVERPQDISHADAIAEGIEADVQAGDTAPLWREYRTGGTTISPTHSYRTLWEQINGPDSWDANPWVWMLEFKRVPA